MFSFFFLIFLISVELSFCIRNNGDTGCPEIEQQSLLSFKQSLKDPHNLLSSWDGDLDCCKWDGVVCSNLTGHVHQLHLQGNLLKFPIQNLRGKISPCLLNLKHLRYLDLSLNNFTGETIPSFIASFPNLQHLNLSHSGFHGKIPHNLGNLSNLHTLDLDSEILYVGNELEVDSLEWLSGLSGLEYLNMNYVNLSKANNWLQVINTLPSLVKLYFQSCSLDFTAPLNYVNSTSLAFLDLSSNYNALAIPRWIFQLSNLLSLDLSYNRFNGPIPTLSNATKLQYIDLSINNFNSSTIPDWLYLCKDLEFVFLAQSFLHGTISSAIANLTSLKTLYLKGNKLSGKMPKEIANLCKIQLLDLSDNNLQGDLFGNMSDSFLGECLSGAIPISIGKLSSLRYLLLNDNKFTGNLPESLGQLFNLRVLKLDDNMLEGVVTESHFWNLTNLLLFSASGNHLTLKVSPNWIPPFQLNALRLGSWDLGAGSPIPSWLQTQKHIISLDLSNTGISGTIPTWVWGDIGFLNLSHNHLHGEIPYRSGISGTQFVYLSSNRFSGPLPQITDTVRELDLSNNSFSGGMSHFLCDTKYETYYLQILQLGGNRLSGEIPDCWMKWPSLIYLNIGNNNMSGSIPNSIGSLVDLKSLNLYGNKISGQIPCSMRNCTKLVKIDVSDNELVGSIPKWMGTSLAGKLKILILRSNKFTGNISSEICHLHFLQILDLSDNQFSGIIPWCVYNFTAMATKRSLYSEDSIGCYDVSGTFIESASVATKGSELVYDTILELVTNIDLSKNNLSGDIPKELTSLVELGSLNLSGNHLTGSIPDKIGDMKQLESLDLSRNSLSGQIPNTLAQLYSLNHLNLSYNNLSGRIPESTQLQSLDASSYVGNNLCGPPLTSSCSYDGDEGHGRKEENEGGESEIEWVYVFLSLGYAVGFSGVCSALVLNKSWRETYFGWMENMWNKCYVYIKWTRFTKPSGATP